MPELGALGVNLAVTAIVALVVVLVTFGVGVAINRHRVVDVAWGLGFAVIAITSLVLSAGHGSAGSRWLVTVLTVVWGVRLAIHIARRSRGEPEDPRYEELLAQASGNRNLYALRVVYLLQGLSIWFISWPVQVAAYDPDPLSLAIVPGICLWLIGFFFEAVGDAQLARFKADPANKGAVMDRGLWRYTRHPNYFGDACVWWGLTLLACRSWLGLITVVPALFMTWLLARKTGKPLLEEHMKRRRPGYASYIERTSGFLPLPPRRP